MTINKSQGGTFDMVGLDAASPVFIHRQAYIAASSVRECDKLTVLTPNGEPSIKNIVLSEVFDKDDIDDQIRRRTACPINSDCSHTANENVFTSAEDINDQIDEELEHYLQQFDHRDVHEACNPNQD
jgi:hypothetical protein